MSGPVQSELRRSALEDTHGEGPKLTLRRMKGGQRIDGRCLMADLGAVECKMNKRARRLPQ